MAEIVKKLGIVNFTLYWILRDAGVEGNEQADRLANVATREESDESLQRDGIP